MDHLTVEFHPDMINCSPKEHYNKIATIESYIDSIIIFQENLLKVALFRTRGYVNYTKSSVIEYAKALSTCWFDFSISEWRAVIEHKIAPFINRGEKFEPKEIYLGGCKVPLCLLKEIVNILENDYDI